MCGCIESKCFRICCERCIVTQDEKHIKDIVEGDSCNKNNIELKGSHGLKSGEIP